MQTVPVPRRRPSTQDVLSATAAVARTAAERAASLDEDFAFPTADIATLHEAGFLLAPLPLSLGGEGFANGAEATRRLAPILRILGSANLSLARLYEGHVNAVGLVARYGAREQIAALGADARGGALFGVWAADDSEGLKLVEHGDGWRLVGRKILCSGASFIARPLIVARDEAGRVLMALPRLKRGERANLSGWTPQGMRASATGTVDFTGIEITPGEIVGGEGDYHRQPAFSGGAWRFLAVQLGAMEALRDLFRERLAETGRGGDPHQRARFGEVSIAVETARLWVERASEIAETPSSGTDATVAYVNLARLAVERAALDLLEIVHRSVGLASLMRPNPIERVSRDLATYLRQPAPDHALATASAWLLERPEPVAELWR
jgi:alkylation response protein AidB-like acyl-CoA dehydrogenase